MTIDLAPDYLELVRTILQNHLPESAEVCIFGSRAKGTSKKFSDIDLAIHAPNQKLDEKIMADLRHDFEESDLPYKVDIVELNEVSQHFRKIIEKDMIKINLTAGRS